jgi:hypothetical protein
MAHELPTRGDAQSERAAQTDDPTLPAGPPAGEPADPAVPLRPTGVGVLAGILFLVVLVALLLVALLWGIDVLF